MRVIVGITCTITKSEDRVCLALSYLNSLPADIIPVLLYLDKACVKDIIPVLDGIILSGGGDIAPFLTNADQADSIDIKRDDFEIELVSMARTKDIPVLGICRGIQVINTAFGGTLFGHIDGHDKGINHKILINKNTKLNYIYGDELMVNSYHHQSIKSLASDFKVTAVSQDGVIEAIELGNIMGVQWHPERMDHHKEIFNAFSEMCHLQKMRNNSIIYETNN